MLISELKERKNCKAPCFEAFMINDKIYKKTKRNKKKPGKKKETSITEGFILLDLIYNHFW